jgi:hypothetical protein
MKFLPAEFHQHNGILQMTNLAREEFHVMGSDAQLVVLSIGLALRDIEAVHFHEDGEVYPEDVPEWVKTSPYEIGTMERLLNTWAHQLDVTEEQEVEESQNETPGHVDVKGKGKAKETRRAGKRKAKTSDGSETKDTAAQ